MTRATQCTLVYSWPEPLHSTTDKSRRTLQLSRATTLYQLTGPPHCAADQTAALYSRPEPPHSLSWPDHHTVPPTKPPHSTAVQSRHTLSADRTATLDKQSRHRHSWSKPPHFTVNSWLDRHTLLLTDADVLYRRVATLLSVLFKDEYFSTIELIKVYDDKIEFTFSFSCENSILPIN